MPEMPLAPDLQQNPLRAVSAVRRRSQDGAFVVFGATGDLMKRKLMPARYSLAAEGMLPPVSRWLESLGRR
jgi:glucose-6-phosphate 1-dehydrogenase